MSDITLLDAWTQHPVAIVNRHWRPVWLLISGVGAIVAYRTVMDSMPPCDCFEWKYLAVMLDELVVPFATSAFLVIVGVVASFGAGDEFVRFFGAVLRRSSAVVDRSTRSPKVRWALGLATLLWVPVFFWGCGLALVPPSGAPNPFLSTNVIGLMIMVGAVVAYFATSVVLWVVLSVGKWLLHVLGVGREASKDGPAGPSTSGPGG